MKKLIIILIASLLLFSCKSHYRWIQEHKDVACDVCNQHNIILTDTIYKTKDTIIFVYRDKFVSLPSDTVIIERIIRSNNLDTITKKYGIITLSAWVNSSLLGATAYINDSTMLVKDTIIKEIITNEKNISTYEKNIQKEPFIPWWYWVLLGFVGAFMLFIGLKIR